jgi:diphosphomevalonate decarboxylase
MHGALATAHSNIALAKYWGKADITSNMPAVPSVSMTLDAMTTTTRVSFDATLEADELRLDDRSETGPRLARVAALLSRVREEANSTTFARVESWNDFPTAAGLASSASGFAALALAARGAAGLPHDMAAASALARQSSASAARSLYGGYVALDQGQPSARRIAGPGHFPLELIVAVTSVGPKDVGSTEGMEHTRRTSPYYAAWVEHSPALAAAAERAILDESFDALGPVVEHSALLMHASMLGADPAIIYVAPATLGVMARVRALRNDGIGAFYTMDAGPHVKVITRPADAARVERALAETPGVQRTIRCQLGGDAALKLDSSVEPESDAGA